MNALEANWYEVSNNQPPVTINCNQITEIEHPSQGQPNYRVNFTGGGTRVLQPAAAQGLIAHMTGARVATGGR